MNDGRQLEASLETKLSSEHPDQEIGRRTFFRLAMAGVGACYATAVGIRRDCRHRNQLAKSRSATGR
jgi:hypothetical protein